MRRAGLAIGMVAGALIAMSCGQVATSGARSEGRVLSHRSTTTAGPIVGDDVEEVIRRALVERGGHRERVRFTFGPTVAVVAELTPGTPATGNERSVALLLVEPIAGGWRDAGGMTGYWDGCIGTAGRGDEAHSYLALITHPEWRIQQRNANKEWITLPSTNGVSFSGTTPGGWRPGPSHEDIRPLDETGNVPPCYR